MKYLHTMVRVRDLKESLHFYCDLLGLEEVRRKDYPEGKFTLVFLATPDENTEGGHLELTHNWDTEAGRTMPYPGGRNFGHLAYGTDDLYALCEKLEANHVIINRPPRDGRMAFVKSPDGISIELLQNGDPLPPHPEWSQRENIGEW